MTRLICRAGFILQQDNKQTKIQKCVLEGFTPSAAVVDLHIIQKKKKKKKKKKSIIDWCTGRDLVLEGCFTLYMVFFGALSPLESVCLAKHNWNRVVHVSTGYRKPCFRFLFPTFSLMNIITCT